MNVRLLVIIIAAVSFLNSCDSVSAVTESDYSSLDRYYFTANRHGWDKHWNKHAQYRIVLPDTTRVLVGCLVEQDTILIEEARVFQPASDAYTTDLSALSEEKWHNLRKGIRIMEDNRLHFLYCTSADEIECRLWVPVAQWIDLCRRNPDYSSRKSDYEIKIGNGWTLNPFPPTEYERYYRHY